MYAKTNAAGLLIFTKLVSSMGRGESAEKIALSQLVWVDIVIR
jgi:hypothetical protein